MALTASVSVLAFALLSALSVPAADATSPRQCDRFAAVGGNDSARGTHARPVHSARRLVRSLKPGQTGCFRKGEYSFSQLIVATPRITLTSVGHRRAELKGDLKVNPSGKRSVIKGLRLNGAGGANEIGPRIYAHGVALRRNRITNHHTGICVLVGPYYSGPAPRNVVIARNRIHDCGALPSTNKAHGIYLSGSRNAVIRRNWIYGNADRGIQQYPNANGSLIVGNVIDSNGDGINFGGNASGACSNDNVVTGNVIANSKRGWNAYSGAEGPTCHGNRLRNNCVFGSNRDNRFNRNGGVQTPSRNFTAAGNRVARPFYRRADAGDFRLRRGSRCAQMLRSARARRIAAAHRATTATPHRCRRPHRSS